MLEMSDAGNPAANRWQKLICLSSTFPESKDKKALWSMIFFFFLVKNGINLLHKSKHQEYLELWYFFLDSALKPGAKRGKKEEIQ